MVWKPLAVVFALTSAALATGWYAEHDAATWAARKCADDREAAERDRAACSWERTQRILGR